MRGGMLLTMQIIARRSSRYCVREAIVNTPLVTLTPDPSSDRRELSPREGAVERMALTIWAPLARVVSQSGLVWYAAPSRTESGSSTPYSLQALADDLFP